MVGEGGVEFCGDVVSDSAEAAVGSLRGDVEVWALGSPLLLDAIDVVVAGHLSILSSTEDSMSSVEDNLRWSLLAAVAPITWGATYYVTGALLPADYPLWGGTLRALPAGLLLLLLLRRLPTGAWWWKSAVLGTLNMGLFFTLVYLAAQLLPSSVAATIMAMSPAVVMIFGWLIQREHSSLFAMLGAAVGFLGVVLMVWSGDGGLSAAGIGASAGAMALSSLGFVLTKRWTAMSAPPTLPMLSWQLVLGGLLVLPFAALVEGAPPQMTGERLLGYGYIAIVATVIAYLAWYTALRKIPLGTIGLVGLLNPVTGVILGVVFAAEHLTVAQSIGIALVLTGVVLGQPVVARALTRRRRSPASTS